MSLIALTAGQDGQVLQKSLGLTGVALSGGTFTSPTIATPTITSPTITGGNVSPSVTTISGDGAVALASGVTLLTKGSAAAITVAAPGVAGLMVTITGGSDFAHVVTFTGGTLWDGTAGANTTWTSEAVQGSSITVVSVSATKWNVVSLNGGTVAPA